MSEKHFIIHDSLVEEYSKVLKTKTNKDKLSDT